jgi:hypothetical protein
MKNLIKLSLLISGLLVNPASSAPVDKSPADSNPLKQCKAQAQSTWDKGGRPYEGNDIYRTCLQGQIQAVAQDIFPGDKGAAFLAQMDKATTEITQTYSLVGDQLEKAKRPKAFDPATDASDLAFYEGLLTQIIFARDVLKGGQ